jgi:hypothetical protein
MGDPGPGTVGIGRDTEDPGRLFADVGQGISPGTAKLIFNLSKSDY